MAFLLTFLCSSLGPITERIAKNTEGIPRCERLFINTSPDSWSEAEAVWRRDSDTFLDLSSLASRLSQSELEQLALRAAVMASTHSHSHIIFAFPYDPPSKDQILKMLDKLNRSKEGKEQLDDAYVWGVRRSQIVLDGFECLYQFMSFRDKLNNIIEVDAEVDEIEISAAMQGVPSTLPVIARAFEEVALVTYYDVQYEQTDQHSQFFNSLCVGKTQDADKAECILLGTNPSEDRVHEVRSALKGQRVAVAVHTSKELGRHEKGAYKLFESDLGHRVAVYCRY